MPITLEPTVDSPPEVEIEALIEEARRRQRHRRLAVVAGLLAAALLAIILGSGGVVSRSRPSSSGSWPFAGAAAIEPASAVFLQPPSMGVACHIADSAGCDRVGLTVWLARRASVIATIAGARVRLNDRHWSYAVHYRGKTQYVYTGFLAPAGLTTRLHVKPNPRTRKWFGRGAPSPVVRFRIDFGLGNVVFTRQRVLLRPGWG